MLSLDLAAPDILLDLGRSVGLLTLVSVVYATVLRRLSPWPWIRQIALGLLFGGAGILAMLDPVHIAPGVVADARTVMVSLAAALGGPLAAVLTALAVGAYRLWLGGVGAAAGILGVTLTCWTGLAFWFVMNRHGIGWKVRHLFLLGVAAGPVGLSSAWLLLPAEVAGDVIGRAGLPLVLMSIVGTTILGTFLLREEQRVAGEAALRRSEARYRLITEGVSDVIVKADLDGVWTYCSDSVRDVFGYEPQELIGRRFEDIAHPDDRQGARDLFRRLRAREAASGIAAARMGRKDGRQIWVEFTARLVLDPANGEPCEVVAVARDVSERQEIRDRLHIANERIRRLVESNVIGVVVGDDRGDILEANGCFLDMLGFQREDLQAGRIRWADVTPAEYRPADQRALDELHARGTCTPYEKQYQRRDGTRLWVQIGAALLPGTDGQIIGFVLDISDRKLLEQARYAAESRVGLAMRAASITFWSWEVASGRMFRVQPGAGPDGGLEEHPFGNVHGFVDDVHPDDREAVRLAFRRAAGEGGPFAVEFRHVGPDGALRWLSGTGMVERDAAGHPLRMVGVNVDITARKAVETALAEARDAADTANAAKGRFLAGLSHELRTPLTAIIGFSDMIARETLGPVGDTQYVQFGTDIRDSGQHLLELINELLDHAKVDAGALALHEETVDLAAAVTFCTRMIGPRAERADITLAPSIADEARWIRADEKRIRQILLNLVSNAVKYTPSGGRVAIAVLLEDGAPTIRVSDTGIGIEEKDLERVLEAFVQIENQANRQSIGTGLGLPLTRKLAELHGGTLTLSSRPGAGTTITIALPGDRLVRDADAAEPSPIPSPASVPDAAERSRPHTILLADDDPLARLGATAILELSGHRVIQAANANEALAVLQGTAPVDLLFADAVMPPGMNGAELAVHATRLRPGLKVLLTSGFGTQAVLGGDANEESHELLTKPFAPAELTRRIARLLGPAAAGPERAGGPRRILLAEDTPMNRTLIATLLRRAGHAVALAADGREALEAVHRDRYDLVLMDVQMPVMDGLEATRRIRSLPGDAGRTPVVALTADVQPHMIEACLMAGMEDYTLKPIERDLLLATIDRWARTPVGAADL